MKKILIVILSLFSFSALAANNSDKFFLKTFATIEYSAPSIHGTSVDSRYRTRSLDKQIRNFENIAIGASFRVHQFLGFNLNWVQSDISNAAFPGVSLSQRSHFNIDHYNFSALFYTPKFAKDMLEFFAELGVADMRSRLHYVDLGGAYFNSKSHATAFLYGAGMQLTPFSNSDDAFRLSFQKYTPQSVLLHGDYMTVRIGYMKAF